MKKFIVVLMAMGLFGVMPVLAADHNGMKMDSHEGMKMDTSDGARECALQAESIQQKVKRIQSEINKGSKKYSAAELKKLNAKLQETNKLLENMTKGGN